MACLRPRIAGISYLNSAPYFSPFRLGVIDAPFDLDLMTPAECNRRIADGRADGGLISSIAWARLGGDGGEMRLLPGFEIASDGDVGSISVYARDSWRALRRVAVTDESATSVEMLRVLLDDAGSAAELVVSDAPLAAAEGGLFDGALLIGDSAMRPAPAGFRRWDLGAVWKERFGTPMVYAVFALRAIPAAEVSRIRGALEAALAWSRVHLDAVIDEWYNRPSAVANPAPSVAPPSADATSCRAEDGLPSVAPDRAALRLYLERLDAARSRRDLGQGLEEFLLRWRRVQAARNVDE